jgi:anti-sigma B factor antagonist
MEPGVAVIALSGRLVFGRELQTLESEVRSLIDGGDRRFILDAGALDYIDSAGIGALVSCLSNVKTAGGEMRVAAASERIKRLFTMTGVDKLMTVYASVAEAAAG